MSLINLQEELQAVKDEMETNRRTGLDTSSFEMRIAILNQQILTEESQQNLQERVEQAKVTGYIADDLKANGIPLIELSHTPENYELTAIAFQKWALGQQDAFEVELKGLEQTLEQTTELLRLSYAENDRQESTNFQQDLEIKDLEKRLKNAATIIDEKDAEIKALKDQQVNAQAVEVAPLSAEEQETKLVADLMGNRLKVTSIRFKDESGLDRRKVLANNALTFELIEEYAIYSKTRWEEISEEAAQQLREEYTSKKAEIELSIPVITTPDIPPVTASTGQDEAATETPFQDQTSEATDSEGNPSMAGNIPMDESLGSNEGEVVSRAEFNELKGRVDTLFNNQYVGQKEVA